MNRNRVAKRLDELERLIPAGDVCLGCKTACPQEGECIHWTLRGVLLQLEQAKRKAPGNLAGIDFNETGGLEKSM